MKKNATPAPPFSDENSLILLIESIMQLQAVKNPELAAKQARLLAILKRGTSSAPAGDSKSSDTGTPRNGV